MHYLTDLRLGAAIKLLEENPDLPIKNICYECGFSSSDYFATVFSKKYKCAPSEYRRSAKAAINKNHLENSPLKEL
jgi:AraC family L-rhamnose operon regulatory protein RhaS